MEGRIKTFWGGGLGLGQARVAAGLLDCWGRQGDMLVASTLTFPGSAIAFCIKRERRPGCWFLDGWRGYDGWKPPKSDGLFFEK